MSIIAAEDIKYIKGFALFLLTMVALNGFFWLFGIQGNSQLLIIGQIALLGALLLLCLGKLKEIHLYEAGKFRLPLLPAFVLTGLALNFFLNWLQLAALKAGLVIAPGAYQVSVIAPGTAGVDALLTGLGVVFLGPALEEIFFRMIGLGLVYRAVLSAGLRGTKSSGPVFIIWLIGVSVIFAGLHGPGQISFPVYFGLSIIYSLVYLKYGLFASILVHSSFNGAAYMNLPWG